MSEPTPGAKPAIKNKGGRPKAPKLDPEAVAAALATQHGNVAAVARQFGVARSSVGEMIGRRPVLQRVAADAREGMLDNAVSSLYRAVLAGEAWAVCFFLKTQGKARGYVERAELTGANGGPVEHKHSGGLNVTLDPTALRAFYDDLTRAGLGDVPPDGAPKPLGAQAADLRP